MGREYHIMSYPCVPYSSLGIRCLPMGFLLLILSVSTGSHAQLSGSPSSTASGSGIHAGWQMGPAALHTERNRSFGAHHLGNTGYGHALSVQSAWKGPWEFELKASRSVVVTDDGAMRGWQTEIQSGEFMVNWVWKGAGNRQDARTRQARISKGFQPFIGLGIGHVDHLMTQDLEDAFGRPYHLWSDGTLRNVAEDGDHDGSALILRRDYTYESEMSAQSGVATKGRSVAIPAQMGVRLDVSPRIRTRFGIGGWLGLDDGVDGQSSGRILAGDALATGFFGIGIRLGKLAAKPAPLVPVYGVSSEDAVLLADMDTDGDGVSNLYDKCPGTRGIKVDAFGCPIDSDGDGYADHRDLEPFSPHLDVDAHGIAIDTAATAGNHKSFVTPKSMWDEVRGRVTSDEPAPFTLRVSKPSDGWTLAEHQTLLAFRNLKETSKSVEVALGMDPLEVGQAVHAVREAGMEAEIIASEHADEAALEAVNIDAPILERHGNPVTHFRVQLGAYKTPDPSALDALFEGLDVIRFKGEDGMTRVVSGAFDQREAAVKFKVRMVTLGFTGAFITSHLPGSTTTTIVGPEATTTDALEQQPQFDRGKIAFRIQLGALKTRMSVEAMDGLLELGEVEHRSATGWHRYLHGNFTQAEAAREALPGIHAAGFPDAFIVGDVSGRIVPVAEAEILLNQD